MCWRCHKMCMSTTANPSIAMIDLNKWEKCSIILKSCLLNIQYRYQYNVFDRYYDYLPRECDMSYIAYSD